MHMLISSKVLQRNHSLSFFMLLVQQAVGLWQSMQTALYRSWQRKPYLWNVWTFRYIISYSQTVFLGIGEGLIRENRWPYTLSRIILAVLVLNGISIIQDWNFEVRPSLSICHCCKKTYSNWSKGIEPQCMVKLYEVHPNTTRGEGISGSRGTLTRGVVCGVCPSQYNPGMVRVSLDPGILWLFAMPKDGQGS